MIILPPPIFLFHESWLHGILFYFARLDFSVLFPSGICIFSLLTLFFIGQFHISNFIFTTSPGWKKYWKFLWRKATKRKIKPYELFSSSNKITYKTKHLAYLLFVCLLGRIAVYYIYLFIIVEFWIKSCKYFFFFKNEMNRPSVWIYII